MNSGIRNLTRISAERISKKCSGHALENKRAHHKWLRNQFRKKNIMPTTSDTPKPKSQSKSVVIPPLPDGFMGARIAPHDLGRYQRGEAICAYICNPDDIIGKHHWIWYDFKTGQPRCELTPPPADRYNPMHSASISPHLKWPQPPNLREPESLWHHLLLEVEYKTIRVSE